MGQNKKLTASLVAVHPHLYKRVHDQVDRQLQWSNSSGPTCAKHPVHHSCLKEFNIISRYILTVLHGPSELKELASRGLLFPRLAIRNQVYFFPDKAVKTTYVPHHLLCISQWLNGWSNPYLER